MKSDLLEHIVCPVHGTRLTLHVDSASDGEIMEGRLACEKGDIYPITSGVPRLVVSEEPDVDATRTRASFSAKWRMSPGFAVHGAARAFYLNWYLERYGFKDLDGLRGFLSGKRMILEAGTGAGRDAILYGENSRAQVFALDITTGIDAAYRNAGHLPNVHLIQADLTRLPFPEALFDYVVSDQVLHHTPNTEASFKYLSRYVAPGGHIAAYVYKKKGPIREFCDDFLRERYAGASEQDCYEFSRSMALLGKALSDLNIEFQVPEDIPVLEIKAGKYNLQRFIYYNVFKCYWNDTMDLETNIVTNFDWYHPVHAWRHTSDELQNWCQAEGLDIEHLDIIPSGISVRARKPEASEQ